MNQHFFSNYYFVNNHWFCAQILSPTTQKSNDRNEIICRTGNHWFTEVSALMKHDSMWPVSIFTLKIQKYGKIVKIICYMYQSVKHYTVRHTFHFLIGVLGNVGKNPVFILYKIHRDVTICNVFLAFRRAPKLKNEGFVPGHSTKKLRSLDTWPWALPLDPQRGFAH